MGYIEKNLIDDETIIYRAKIAWAVLFIPLLLTIVLIRIISNMHTIIVVITVAYCIYLITRSILTIITTEFALTNRRIIAKKGFIKRNTMEIHLKQLESMSVSQPLNGRFFGFGTVTVVGTGGTREQFKSILNPFVLQKQVNRQVSKLSK